MINAKIHIDNYYESETVRFIRKNREGSERHFQWFLAVVGFLILLILVLCGAWCLCAAWNVKHDTTMIHVESEDVKKSRNDRSDAGLDTAIEMDGSEERPAAGVMVRLGQSLGLLN